MSLIALDSAIRVNKKYYLQTLLEEYKYEIKKNKMESLINYDLDSNSSDESDNDIYFFRTLFFMYSSFSNSLYLFLAFYLHFFLSS